MVSVDVHDWIVGQKFIIGKIVYKKMFEAQRYNFLRKDLEHVQRVLLPSLSIRLRSINQFPKDLPKEEPL